MINRKNIFWIITLFISISIFLYWSSKKEVFFMDEVLTYESANGFEQSWARDELNKWVSGDDIKNFLAANDRNLSYDIIAKNLYTDHVPLYFWMFRTVSVLFFFGIASKWIGLSINLLFYSIFISVLYYAFFRIFESAPKACIFVVSLLSFNGLIVDESTMLRMYMMLASEVVSLAVIACWLLEKIKQNEHANGISIKQYIAAFLLLSVNGLVGFLTHFDYWIYYATVSATFCAYFSICALISKGKKWYKTSYFVSVCLWIASFIISLGLTYVIFPKFRQNLKQDKGGMAIDAISVFSKEKKDYILWGFQNFVRAIIGRNFPVYLGLIIVFVIILFGMIIIKKNGRKILFIQLLLVLISSVLYQLAVCFTLPAGREERYLWPSHTVILIIVGICFYFVVEYILSKASTKANIPFIVISLFLLITNMLTIGNGSNLKYLTCEGKNEEVLKEYSTCPWIVYGMFEYPWDMFSTFDFINAPELIFMTADEGTDEVEALQRLKNVSSFVIYVYPHDEENVKTFLNDTLDKDLKFEYITKSSYYNVYCVKQ